MRGKARIAEMDALHQQASRVDNENGSVDFGIGPARIAAIENIGRTAIPAIPLVEGRVDNARGVSSRHLTKICSEKFDGRGNPLVNRRIAVDGWERKHAREVSRANSLRSRDVVD